MPTFEELLGQARPPEHEVQIVMRADLAARYERLEEQLADAEEADAVHGSLASGAVPRRVAEEMEALRQQMQDSVQVFLFRGLGQRAYSDLAAKHPPRKDHTPPEDDVNWNTFPAALIQAACASPKISDEQIKTLEDTVTNRQWDLLFAGAYAVNKMTVDVPKSGRASAILASAARKSRPPAPGASAAAVSSAGSLAG